jgi:hypothetical protein
LFVKVLKKVVLGAFNPIKIGATAADKLRLRGESKRILAFPLFSTEKILFLLK